MLSTHGSMPAKYGKSFYLTLDKIISKSPYKNYLRNMIEIGKIFSRIGRREQCKLFKVLVEYIIMMQLIEFPLRDGGSVFVEVNEFEEAGGIDRAAKGESKIAEKAVIHFEDALNNIKPAAASIISNFRNLNDRPNEVEIEFGLKMNAAAGTIITSGGIEANFKVILRWKGE